MTRPLYHRRFLHTFYVRSRQRADEFHEARLVRITNGGLAIWLHPVGMLEPQVVVNLLPELGVGVETGETWLLACERPGGVVGQSWRREHAPTAK